MGVLGPQPGIGRLAVADWWLVIAFAEAGDLTAAAAPATTTVRAKMRMTSFMVITSIAKICNGRTVPPVTKNPPTKKLVKRGISAILNDFSKGK